MDFRIWWIAFVVKAIFNFWRGIHVELLVNPQKSGNDVKDFMWPFALTRFGFQLDSSQVEILLWRHDQALPVSMLRYFPFIWSTNIPLDADSASFYFPLWALLGNASFNLLRTWCHSENFGRGGRSVWECFWSTIPQILWPTIRKWFTL